MPSKGLKFNSVLKFYISTSSHSGNQCGWVSSENWLVPKAKIRVAKVCGSLSLAHSVEQSFLCCLLDCKSIFLEAVILISYKKKNNWFYLFEENRKRLYLSLIKPI